MKPFYICIGPRCWGRAETTGEAIQRAKKAYPTFAGPKNRMNYDLYEVQEDDYVDAAGNICARAEDPPKKIREVRWLGEQRTVKQKCDAPLPLPPAETPLH